MKLFGFYLFNLQQKKKTEKFSFCLLRFCQHFYFLRQSCLGLCVNQSAVVWLWWLLVLVLVLLFKLSIFIGKTETNEVCKSNLSDVYEYKTL